MKWPDKPSNHSAEWQARRWQQEWDWQPRGKYRYCSYCGSIHPEDLLTVIANGARLGGSDWKYGYPHKFYINNADDRNAIKFYSRHLLDEGYDEESMECLVETLMLHTGIAFEVRASDEGDRQLWYAAPYAGYQRF